MDATLGDGCSHTAGCHGPRKDVPREFWREGWSQPDASVLPTVVLPHRAGAPGPPPHPAPLAGAAASPGEVDALLGELAGAVDGVLVGLVLHHLHTLALLALLVTVLADGVELPYAVLQPQRPASALPSPAPAPSRQSRCPGWAPLCRANGFPAAPLRGETEARSKGVGRGLPGQPVSPSPAPGLLQHPGEGQMLPSWLFPSVLSALQCAWRLSAQQATWEPEKTIYIYRERYI